MKLNRGLLPDGSKQVMAICGLLLILPGFVIGFGFLCLTLLLVIEGESEGITVGLIGVLFLALTVGTGGALFWHSMASLQGRPSKQIRLPSMWAMGGIFALYVGVGAITFQSEFLAGLFFPPSVLIIAAIPPLLAVSWFMNRQEDGGITWRRSVVAFAGSALLGLIIVITSQVSLLIIISFLASNPADAIIGSLDLVGDLAGRDLVYAISTREFIVAFVQITIIIPIAGTMAKSLVTIPLSGYLSHRQMFIIGTIAGAGFAALESIVYIGFWPSLWAWLLLIQALGGAIHPLGAGILAIGWKDLLDRKASAWPHWLARFGVATALHMVWNTGLLLFVILISISGRSIIFLGSGYLTLPIVVLLMGLGLVTFWAGRSLSLQTNYSAKAQGESEDSRFTLSNRAMAVWALACVVAIVPLGIAGLQIWSE